MNSEIEDKIRNTDWAKYNGPEYYDADELKNALLALGSHTGPDKDDDLYNRVEFAFGNPHRGTYYPAILEAIDILIHIENDPLNHGAKTVAQKILIDICSYELELSAYTQHSNEFIENFVETKIEKFQNL